MSIQKVSNKLKLFSSSLAYLGAIALLGMMCLTTADVIGRYIFNSPVVGAYELTEFLVLILIFSYLAYTQSMGSHVSVELIVNKLPRTTQIILHVFNHTVSLIIWGLIAWKGFENAVEQMGTGEISPNLAVPNYPFIFFLSLGCFVMCIEYLRNILQIFGTQIEDIGI